MLTNIDITNWTPIEVKSWLSGLCDNNSWLNVDYIFNNNVNGAELLLMSAQDLSILGATKVNLQEHILECLDRLKFFNTNVSKETLQLSMLRLACQSRSLQYQLVADEDLRELQAKVSKLSESDFRPRQRVSLDTLVSVSSIVLTVRRIIEILNSKPFLQHDFYRSIKSLLLSQSIKLSSTAQRDQFVEKPNYILYLTTKRVADNCDKVVLGHNDLLLIQPFQLETLKIRRSPHETSLGLIVKSQPNCSMHIIDSILPLSPAKKTNKLTEGDEILQINEFIIGWSAKNVMTLLNQSNKMEDVVLMVKKYPNDT